MSQVNRKLQKVPKGYKQTDIGVIPEDWNISTVGNEFSIKLGKMLDAEKNSGVLKPYIGNRAVQWGRINVDAVELIKLTVDDLKRYKLAKGDLLVCEGGEVGRAAIWEDQLGECYYQKALHRLRPSKSYCSLLLIYILDAYVKNNFIFNFVTQTSIAHLPKDKFQLVPLPLPKEEEQTAIANALSDVDTLITSLEKLIDKKRAIKTAAMQQLLTGKKRLPPFDKLKIGYKKTELGEIPGDWEVRTIESISLVPIQNGLFYEPSRKGRGVSLINVGDLYKSAPIDINALEFFDADKLEISTFRVTNGDLFFTRSSIVPSGIAYCNIYDTADFERDVVFDSHLIRVRVNAAVADAKYIYLACMSNIARRFLISSAKTATMTTIDQGAIKNCPILQPPKAEQVAIAGVLTDMDKEINALEQRLNKTQQIKQGMMQELLTGRTRLV